jgi:hypothetical protein
MCFHCKACSAYVCANCCDPNVCKLVGKTCKFCWDRWADPAEIFEALRCGECLYLLRSLMRELGCSFEQAVELMQRRLESDYYQPHTTCSDCGFPGADTTAKWALFPEVSHFKHKARIP